MKAEDLIKAWTDMNEELKEDDPGIRVNVPTKEETEQWMAGPEELIKKAAALLAGKLEHQTCVDSAGRECKRYIITYGQKRT